VKIYSFYWTKTNGLNLIDTPESWAYNYLGSMSPDGKFAVGTLFDGMDNRAYLWDAENRTRLIEDILTDDYGIDLGGWTLLNATGISANGTTICGEGINPAGNFEGWVATIPEPASLLLLAAGSIILRSRKR
jgi:hypothetical protein